MPLAGQDLVRLAGDAALRRLYIECLVYMHDLVCEVADDPTPARFPSRQDVRIDTGVIQQRHFAGNDSLSRNVQQNLEMAFDLGTTALVKRDYADIQSLRREVEAFMSGVLFTYNQVRLLD